MTCAVFLRFDKNFDFYERKTYSLLDLLGDIGGLTEALVFIATILVISMAKQFMLSHIMSEVFYVSKP